MDALIMQLNELQYALIADVALGEATGARRVVVRAKAGALRVNTILEAVVCQRDYTQIATICGRERIALDIGQYISDVVHHLPLGVAGTRPPPGDTALPVRIGCDGAFERRFQRKW
jgi:hypothetical protein